jgi:hypothetical protein
MNLTASLALIGWPIISVLQFAYLRPRRAVIASVILAWLFLPMAALKAPGLPIYNKVLVTAVGPLLGVALFDLRRILSFRPAWVDLPMAIWCLCPFASSLGNDLGVHDGISAVISQTAQWGLPYLFGRIYCSDLLGVTELAIGILVGGLLYVPLCLFEVRMSPQLHLWVYGFYQHDFGQAIRGGGFRPTVFMEHGIMVAMWMAMTSLVGVWLWISGTLRYLFRIPLLWFLIPLVVTAALCKTLGAFALMSVGLVVLWATRVGSTRFFVIVLALISPLYLALRIPKIWTGSELTEAAEWVSADRAGSLKFRIINEDMLVDRACLRPVFGWGAWGRARVYDETGRDVSVTDSLWIIEFGNHGLVGLLAMVSAFTVPLAGLISRIPASSWRHRMVAPAVALCVMVLLYGVDCMFNAMNNPAYTMAAGGLACLRVGLLKKRVPAATSSKDDQWSPQSPS